MCPESTGSSSSSKDVAEPGDAGREILTDAQRAFAQMLGRLLADLWDKEQADSRRQRPDSETNKP
jgi:hypothetical protein